VSPAAGVAVGHAVRRCRFVRAGGFGNRRPGAGIAVFSISARRRQAIGIGRSHRGLIGFTGTEQCLHPSLREEARADGSAITVAFDYPMLQA